MSDEKDYLDRPLWGAKAIGEEINKSQRETFHLLESGLLPARKLGKFWITTPRQLRAFIAGLPPATAKPFGPSATIPA
jgi:hypothetical protein